MEDQITTVFYWYDTLLQTVGIREDPQGKKVNAEVMTVALTANQARGLYGFGFGC
jgi:hypothetical protein